MGRRRHSRSAQTTHTQPAWLRSPVLTPEKGASGGRRPPTGQASSQPQGTNHAHTTQHGSEAQFSPQKRVRAGAGDPPRAGVVTAAGHKPRTHNQHGSEAQFSPQERVRAGAGDPQKGRRRHSRRAQTTHTQPSMAPKPSSHPRKGCERGQETPPGQASSQPQGTQHTHTTSMALKPSSHPKRGCEWGQETPKRAGVIMAAKPSNQKGKRPRKREKLKTGRAYLGLRTQKRSHS
jgi:hypothetical protein